MIIKYKPLILSIELLSNIILISINKNINIHYKEVIKENSTDELINFIHKMLIKNYIKAENINLIILNYGIYNYTNSKIISAIIQSISLSMKLPTIKISSSYTLALNVSKIEKKKYIIITHNENKNHISEEIYVKNKQLKILSNELIYIKKNNLYIKKNTKEINKNLHLYKNNKIIPNIYTFFFAKTKKIFNKFELPNKITPTYANKNFYSYYSE
ncbi:MAG TPA: hypothetical protein ACYCC3_01000 [Candidatus Azoamicus sp.]